MTIDIPSPNNLRATRITRVLKELLDRLVCTDVDGKYMLYISRLEISAKMAVITHKDLVLISRLFANEGWKTSITPNAENDFLEMLCIKEP